MGYYSDFQVADTDIPFVIDVLREYSGNYGDGWSEWSDGSVHMTQVKWYDWLDDLRKVAYAYPNNFLIVVRWGEEPGDISRAVVRDGKVIEQHANITWPELDRPLRKYPPVA